MYVHYRNNIVDEWLVMVISPAALTSLFMLYINLSGVGNAKEHVMAVMPVR